MEADPDQPGQTRAYDAITEAGGRVLRVVHDSMDRDVVVVTAFLDRDRTRSFRKATS